LQSPQHFALRVACGLNPEIIHRGSSHRFVAFLLCSAATSPLIGIVFAWRSQVIVAALACLLCWGMLGVAAVCIQEQPRRADHILSLVDAWKIDWKSPLCREDNPYGNPRPELLERLEASGASVLRTDRDGAVHIVTDGDRLEISCFLACAEAPTVTTSKRAEAPNQDQNNQQ
jgi:hypothetical protein